MIGLHYIEKGLKEKEMFLCNSKNKIENIHYTQQNKILYQNILMNEEKNQQNSIFIDYDQNIMSKISRIDFERFFCPQNFALGDNISSGLNRTDFHQKFFNYESKNRTFFTFYFREM